MTSRRQICPTRAERTEPTTGPDALSARLGYGLPALDGSGLWRFAVGAAILPEPVFYLVMCPLVVVAVGFYERRMGAARALGVLVATHLIGTLTVAGGLSVASGLDRPWARAIAGETDLGLSAGTVGVLAAATALMAPSLRRRVRWLVTAYLTVMVLRSGLLWDAEHLVGWLAGLAAGPLLGGLQVRHRRTSAPPRGSSWSAPESPGAWSFSPCRRWSRPGTRGTGAFSAPVYPVASWTSAWCSGRWCSPGSSCSSPTPSVEDSRSPGGRPSPW